MALFQQSVLTHHLSAIDETPVQNFTDPFQKVLDCTNYGIEKLYPKLQSWHELTIKQFLKKLKKKKVKLSLNEEADWMEYFNEQKAKADELNTQIEQTDKEIVGMVYELYGLSDVEIGVVEESGN